MIIKSEDIRQIFLNSWDPICISGNKNLHDEYDAYIPQVKWFLENGVSKGGIVKYLYDIEALLRISTSAEAREETADQLLHLIERSE